jgi:hypothetical protein
MPQGAWTDKRERQYDHIKSNLKKRGAPGGDGGADRGSHGESDAHSEGRDEGSQAAERTSAREARHVSRWTQRREGTKEPLTESFERPMRCFGWCHIGMREAISNDD